MITTRTVSIDSFCSIAPASLRQTLNEIHVVEGHDRDLGGDRPALDNQLSRHRANSSSLAPTSVRRSTSWTALATSLSEVRWHGVTDLAVLRYLRAGERPAC